MTEIFGIWPGNTSISEYLKGKCRNAECRKLAVWAAGKKEGGVISTPAMMYSVLKL